MKQVRRKIQKQRGRARRLGYSETRQEFLNNPHCDEWSNAAIGGDGTGEERDHPIEWKHHHDDVNQ